MAIKLLVLTLPILLLAACSGGGGSSSATEVNQSIERVDIPTSVDTATPVNTPTSVAQQPADTTGRLLASNCFQCHGTMGVGGFEKIRGDAGEVDEYLGKNPREDIMAAHAQGYTPSQLAAIVAYLNKN